MSWPSIDHSILSPSGHCSKRAREAALKREYARLFPPDVLADFRGHRPVESKRDNLLRRAKQLRELAARGMHPRSYPKEAARLERLAELETV